MSARLRAELQAVGATPSWWALIAVPVAYPLLIVAALAFAPAGEAADLSEATVVDAIRGTGDVAALALALLGVLMSAGEFRHGTVVPTLLATPSRRSVLGGKLAAAAVVGSVTAATASIAAVGTAVPYLRSEGIAADPLSADVLLSVAGALLACVFTATAGVAVGTIVRNQTAAVAGLLVWRLAVEEAIPVVLGDQGLRRWLPGGAVARMLALAGEGAGRPPALVAAAVLAGVLTALVASASVTARADVR